MRRAPRVSRMMRSRCHPAATHGQPSRALWEQISLGATQNCHPAASIAPSTKRPTLRFAKWVVLFRRVGVGGFEPPTSCSQMIESGRYILCFQGVTVHQDARFCTEMHLVATQCHPADGRMMVRYGVGGSGWQGATQCIYKMVLLCANGQPMDVKILSSRHGSLHGCPIP